MFRFKQIIGRVLRSRVLANQQGNRITLSGVGAV